MVDGDGYITIPVLFGFDSSKPMGSLRVLESALPPSANYVFALGVKLNEGCVLSPNPKAMPVGPYELMCVSMVSDVKYLDYLRQIGVVQESVAETLYNAAMIASNEAGFVGYDAAQTIRLLHEQLTQLQVRERQYLDSIERTEMILNGANPKDV